MNHFICKNFEKTYFFETTEIWVISMLSFSKCHLNLLTANVFKKLAIQKVHIIQYSITVSAILCVCNVWTNDMEWCDITNCTTHNHFLPKPPTILLINWFIAPVDKFYLLIFLLDMMHVCWYHKSNPSVNTWTIKPNMVV